MKRVPVLATLVVAAAVAAMVALGFWQLSRARWKEGLVEQYAAAQKLPPIAFPTAPVRGPLPLFRWATGYCLKPVGQRAIAGESRQGEPGYAHIVQCSTSAEGPGMAVDIGWSKDPNAKWSWPGGPVTGIIVPDRLQRIRLVAASAPAGLEPSATPSVDSVVQVTPAGHRFYAIQWFAFAAIALLIFILAVRKRRPAE
ncbi:MAG: SURF1 family cytochrome oxidase biogenesis protein [Sphingomicrobium sp.]